MIEWRKDSILEAKERDRKKKETENVVETLLQLEQQAQQERQMLAQQMADLELAMLEGGNTNV
ncbi:hypothetical protein [Clostridium sp. MD294]|uniref:hypothetical protein n=1 Tax=Clostridium sp. MD294 TaxID=97138 RepID=UPI0002CBBA26|nr:hypothetical protein [Clostridium sp. MD294]NDO45960.1 hypothetical protein [Clostridium sp. MD294]USF30382.1 hypothetical protein C820_001823 [Clostridium sp. MD294]USF31174.1 hypothetical protein C820_002620 [Clostridium sp. MD294]